MIRTARIIESLYYFEPELVLVLFGLVIIIFDLIKSNISRKIVPLLSVTALVLSTYLVIKDLNMQSVYLFNEMICTDSFSRFFKIIILSGAAFVIVSLIESREIESMSNPEVYALLLFMTVGMMLMVSSVHWIMIVLSIELTGISAYILTGFMRKNTLSGEAAYKYVFYGASATSISLYGISLLYGIGRNLNIYEMGVEFHKIFDAGGASNYSIAIFLGFIFVLAGLGYKISMVPVHLWTPDVYEGAATPITGLLAVCSKTAGFGVFIRVLFAAFPLSKDFIHSASFVDAVKPGLLIALISLLTMTWGNLAALGQKNIKRLLAYSSIAHAGYMLLGVSCLNREGLNAVLMYLVVYLFMNLGAFVGLAALASKTGSENIDDFKGIGKYYPVMGVFFSICLFSLIGLPPFAGYVGKFYIFIALLHQKTILGYLLGFIAVINTVISLCYYIIIVKAMFIDNSEKEIKITEPITKLQMYAMGLLTIPVIILGIWWEPLVEFARLSLHFITII